MCTIEGKNGTIAATDSTSHTATTCCHMCQANSPALYGASGTTQPVLYRDFYCIGCVCTSVLEVCMCTVSCAHTPRKHVEMTKSHTTRTLGGGLCTAHGGFCLIIPFPTSHSTPRYRSPTGHIHPPSPLTSFALAPPPIFAHPRNTSRAENTLHKHIKIGPSNTS